jgi:hypothetical protein
MTASGYIAVIALATLKGALVALPRADALERLKTLRSPAWAVLLPGSILAGTFVPLALPSIAPGLVLLARLLTPLLAPSRSSRWCAGPEPRWRWSRSRSRSSPR